MISKNKLKFIKSLQIKKFRRIHTQFIVEGAKGVAELLNSDYHTGHLFVTQKFADYYSEILKDKKNIIEIVTEEELSKAGTFANNDAALAIVNMKDNIHLEIKGNEYALVLDEVKDPGNLGTIIRIADWYGISKIICSEDCADRYNPKVISASMGSFTRVALFYCDLISYLKDIKDTPIYGATLEGKSIHKEKFHGKGYLVLGNESEGIRDQVKQMLNLEISIPKFGHAESLNVAIAAAVICDRMRNAD
jgi:RNA methyltransferase, TrmH family